MKNSPGRRVSVRQLQVLADFRYQLRLFLLFSEKAAAKAALQPQQHQLMLQIAGAPDGVATTIGYVAERLGLRHNSVVELSDRCAELGLIRRVQGEIDRRCVVLGLTAEGRRVLDTLSLDHAQELRILAPELIRTLTAVQQQSDRRAKAGGDES
jgi:DNA-binding MarR family transcriptional regulator